MHLISAVSLMDGALPTDVSPIIKAVTDPFSLLALVVLVLDLIATKWIPRKQDGKVWPYVVALSILVISLLAIALTVMRYINTAKTGTTAMVDQRQHPLSITINITSNKRALKPTIVPFEVGGGRSALAVESRPIRRLLIPFPMERGMLRLTRSGEIPIMRRDRLNRLRSRAKRLSRAERLRARTETG